MDGSDCTMGLNTVLLFFPAADSTGTHSLYTTYKDYEIMFHVSTLLPYTPNNKQQVKMEVKPMWYTINCVSGKGNLKGRVDHLEECMI